MLRGDWSPSVTLLYYMYERKNATRDRKFMGMGGRSDNHGEKNSRVSVSRGLCDSAHPVSKYACVGKLTSRP